MNPRREEDLEAWKTWKKAPTDFNMQQILDRVNPLIQKEVNRWSGTLARPALELEGKRLAVEALQSYSPTAGASIGTHVTNRLQKLSRLPYTHQNIARIPEYQTLKFHSYNLAKSTLQDRMGRSPTTDELSDELGWSQSYLNRFQKSMHRELTESGPPPMLDTKADEGGVVDFLYHDLAPKQKKLFQFTTGYGGSPVLNGQELMKKLRLTQGQLSYQKRLLINKIQNVTGGTGG